MEEENKDLFVKDKPSKTKPWITDIYYGTKGENEHGHFIASGAIVIKSPTIMKNGTLQDIVCEQPLFHRNAEGEILFDTKIKK